MTGKLECCQKVAVKYKHIEGDSFNDSDGGRTIISKLLVGSADNIEDFHVGVTKTPINMNPSLFAVYVTHTINSKVGVTELEKFCSIYAVPFLPKAE